MFRLRFPNLPMTWSLRIWHLPTSRAEDAFTLEDAAFMQHSLEDLCTLLSTSHHQVLSDNQSNYLISFEWFTPWYFFHCLISVILRQPPVAEWGFFFSGNKGCLFFSVSPSGWCAERTYLRSINWVVNNLASLIKME